MFRTVEIPLWLLVLILAFAAIAVLSHFLVPSVRWFLRLRLNRAIERLNTRLALKIPAFTLTRRRVLVDRLVHDPQVAAAIEDHARTEGVPLSVAADLARRYARETVPSFSAFAYFTFGTRVSRWLATWLYDVRLTTVDPGALDALPDTATVVFVMNHRSNMDYLLVTYLVSDRTTLSYAVGEWAKVWPLSALIRAVGAYFIHRRSRSRLYRRVIARYVQMATEGGVTQALFPEGGLSRDGAPGQPKLGILSYIVEGFAPEGRRDVVFVPVSLAYDRIIEDRHLVTDTSRPVPTFRAMFASAIGFVARQAWKRLKGRRREFGRAAVRIGRPVSLRSFLADAAGGEARPVEALGALLMQRIAAEVPILPVPLVAAALLRHPDGRMALSALPAAVVALDESASGGDARLCDQPDFAADEVIAGAVAQLRDRGIVSVDGVTVALRDGKRPLLAFYANGLSGRLPLETSRATADTKVAQ